MRKPAYKNKKCVRCSKEFLPTSPTQKFCSECRKIVTRNYHTEWAREWRRKIYQKRDKNGYVSPENKKIIRHPFYGYYQNWIKNIEDVPDNFRRRLEKISDKEKRVLKMRFEEKLSFKEIGKIYNVTRQRAHQLFNNIFSKKKVKNIKNILYPTIQELMVESPPLALDVKKIIGSISRNFNISTKDLLGKRRNKGMILPRHLIIYFLRKRLNLSFPKIAKIIGFKDHTTSLYAYKKIERLITKHKIISK